MNDIKSLNHTTWECKYHVVWIPKYQKKTLYVQLRKYLGDVSLGNWPHKGQVSCWKGTLCLLFMLDHVHMLIAIPPKYIASGWLYKGQECHSYCPKVWWS